MTTALNSRTGVKRSKLQEVSLLEGPMLLLRSIRGFRTNRSLIWLATVPVALFGLGIFTFAAKAGTTFDDLTPLQASKFLADNLWLFIATILVIFMNAGFAMVEAGMCRSKKCCKHSC